MKERNTHKKIGSVSISKIGLKYGDRNGNRMVYLIMRPIQRAIPFKVIHWDYYSKKFDKPTQFVVRENLRMLDTPLVNPGDNINRVLRVEWRFKYIYQDGELRLSYIAEDKWLINDYLNANIEEIGEIVKQSYALFTLTFNERKQNSDLKFNYLKPLESLGIALQPILDHLKEPVL